MTRKLFIISAIAFAYLLARQWDTRSIEHPPGILVPEAPVQNSVRASTFSVDDYILTRKASFELRARVLSTEPYYFRRESDLSPVDLALGWGVMSDQAVLDRIEISQGSRWYKTRYQYPAPISDQQITHNSSNMHIVPASKGIGKSLKKLRRGEIINLRGHLVDVDHNSGWRWRTSMTRTDTGAGACEIFYVEQVLVE
jgi:hypothetical protein